MSDDRRFFVNRFFADVIVLDAHRCPMAPGVAARVDICQNSQAPEKLKREHNLFHGRRVRGIAYTAKTFSSDTTGVLRALDDAPPGSVLVIDGTDRGALPWTTRTGYRRTSGHFYAAGLVHNHAAVDGRWFCLESAAATSLWRIEASAASFNRGGPSGARTSR